MLWRVAVKAKRLITAQISFAVYFVFLCVAGELQAMEQMKNKQLNNHLLFGDNIYIFFNFPRG